MSAVTKNYLAMFLGNPNKSMMDEFNALPEAECNRRMKEGGDAWHAWVEKYKDRIVELGSPLGRTKCTSKAGVEDTRNNMGAWTVVRASSHDEAARMFENHPHFSIFPGECVEIMECLPIPLKQ
jgi:hypothetical protein